MPISRKKSCVQCRAAKARCNLERICHRCIDRGLRCSYSDARPVPYPQRHQRQGRTTSLEPEASAPRNSGELSALSDQTRIVPMEGFMDAELGDDQFDDVNNLTAAPIPNMPDWSEAYWNDDVMSTSGAQTELWHNRVMPISLSTELTNRQSQANVFGALPIEETTDSGDQAHKASNDESQNRSAVSDYVDNQQLRRLFRCSDSLYFTPSPRDVITIGRRFTNILSQKITTTPQSFLMNRVLLGQITSYPRMLARGHLPPFIHPTCVLNKLDGSCARDGTHACLPEPLAICSSLLRMFYGRTPQTNAFIWKTIAAEQKRLLEEHQTYDNEMLLAAVQSMVLYVLIQAQDAASIQHNDVRSMITILGELIKRLHTSTDYLSDICQMSTQKEWVINESMRRAGNLIFVLESVLDMVIGRRDVPDCPGFWGIPLPCPRDLWEYRSSEAWSYRLRRYLDSRTSARVLTIRDLQQARQPRAEAATKDRDGGSAGDVAKWCEGIDELGNLVWMATILH